MLKIRKAEITDLPAIVEIYNQAVRAKFLTADTEPTDVNSRRQWFYDHNPDKYPIFVGEIDGQVVGWVSLSAYRPGRKALRHTAEISYYLHEEFQGQGIGSKLMEYVIAECPKYEIKTLFTITLDCNQASINLTKKFNFELWAHLPNIADFDGVECGHVYYGLRVYK